MTAGALEKIKSYKIDEIADRKAKCPRVTVEEAARHAPRVRDFHAGLERALDRAPYAVIAEIKRASPSKGNIRRGPFKPAELARAYEAGGAACLSVLTDAPSFRGADIFLTEAREACALPVLRKDFMLDPYQVAEGRALGADCILIILAIVTDEEAWELERTAFSWGMDVLIEVHDEDELARALLLQSPLIGINNRDLKTFKTTLETAERLAPVVPQDRVVIAESGLSTPDDLARLAKVGVRHFLIGESLMRQDDVEAVLRALLEAPPAPR